MKKIKKTILDFLRNHPAARVRNPSLFSQPATQHVTSNNTDKVHVKKKIHIKKQGKVNRFDS